MKKIILIFLIATTFLLGPTLIGLFPEYSNTIVALIEFFSELWFLIELMRFAVKSKQNRELNIATIAIFISIAFIFITDTLNSSRIIGLSENYALISDWLYNGFAFFLLIFLCIKLGILNRSLNEWFWIFLSTSMIDLSLSYWYLLSPYYLTSVSLSWKISGTIYMVMTVLIFAITLPFAFRLTDRKMFWFFNLLILLLASDFAVRYQDAFIDTTNFSWAEISWYFAFLGLAWIMHLSEKLSDNIISQSVMLAPVISIRSLLTVSICLANNFFLIGILLFKLYSVQTALDISSILLLQFLFWTMANEFSIWLANDLSETSKCMFKSRENISKNGFFIEFHLEKVTSKNHIYEISKILHSYNELVVETNKMMGFVMESNKKATIAEVAFQVSHDIRSPLAALDMSVKALPELSEDIRVLIRSSIGRIKDITNDLLLKNPKVSKTPISDIVSVDDDERSIQLLSSSIDRLISEKRMQYRSKIGVEIDSALDVNSYGIFASINIREFMRVLSNLINNAVEAVNDSGCVTVSLSQTDNQAIINVIDNGKGFPKELLSQIGGRGATLGKENGFGLGLYHAKATIELWGGCLEVKSPLKSGSIVTIRLPLAKTPSWFVENIRVYPKEIIVILDDDISIHQIWSGRFEQLNIKAIDVEVLHFSTPEQLVSWVNENPNILSRTNFFIDYEFVGFDQVGLDIIENLGIQSRSILITSHYEEPSIRSRCEKICIQLIPKDMAGFVPITVLDKAMPDAILIDDDPLVHSCWEFSANKNKRSLATFSSADDFVKFENSFSRNIPIYIDVNLGDNVRGEDLAEHLSGLGFKIIYLATGYDASDYKHLTFIKGVVGKYPPF